MSSPPDHWPPQRLNVTLNGQCCGALWQRAGVMVFDYHPEWIAKPRPLAISQSLPLHAEAHEGPVVEAFFANLLPEGDVRNSISRALKISERNHYALLEAIGGDCAGALSLEVPDAMPPQLPRPKSEFIDREQLAALAAGLLARPLLTGETGVRLSLAGAQAKLALCKAADDWIKPAAGQISTHILKPPIREFPDSVENETFCMSLAKECGLGVPDCWTEPVPRLYVVERYDRRRNPVNGQLERLHQEDFCQALGVPASRKYENEGGPGLAQCFDLVRRVCTHSVLDLQRLLHWTIFNFLIGNHDAHAKNLSLLYVDGEVRLAPFYDLICTAADARLDERFAMKIGGARSARYMTMRNWDAFAGEANLNKRFVRDALTTVSGMVSRGTNVTMKRISLDLPDTFKTIEIILARLKALQKMREAELPQLDLLKSANLGLADVPPKK
ncbi:MAG: type II toxin-antitoxin system HipA family toxin [Panacagrimonas sp.]